MHCRDFDDTTLPIQCKSSRNRETAEKTLVGQPTEQVLQKTKLKSPLAVTNLASALGHGDREVKNANWDSVESCSCCSKVSHIRFSVQNRMSIPSMSHWIKICVHASKCRNPLTKTLNMRQLKTRMHTRTTSKVFFFFFSCSSHSLYTRSMLEVVPKMVKTQSPTAYEFNSGNMSFSQISLFRNLQAGGDAALRFLLLLVIRGYGNYLPCNYIHLRVIPIFWWMRMEFVQLGECMGVVLFSFRHQAGEDPRPFKSREEKMRHILGYFDWRRFQQGHLRGAGLVLVLVESSRLCVPIADQVVCHEGALNDRLWFILEGADMMREFAPH